MDKQILEQYIDACELIKDTKEEIKKLRKRRTQIQQDSVKGSSHEFPYTLQTYHLEGLVCGSKGSGRTGANGGASGKEDSECRTN